MAYLSLSILCLPNKPIRWTLIGQLSVVDQVFYYLLLFIIFYLSAVLLTSCMARWDYVTCSCLLRSFRAPGAADNGPSAASCSSEAETDPSTRWSCFSRNMTAVALQGEKEADRGELIQISSKELVLWAADKPQLPMRSWKYV